MFLCHGSLQDKGILVFCVLKCDNALTSSSLIYSDVRRAPTNSYTGLVITPICRRLRKSVNRSPPARVFVDG